MVWVGRRRRATRFAPPWTVHAGAARNASQINAKRRESLCLNSMTLFRDGHKKAGPPSSVSLAVRQAWRTNAAVAP